MARHVPHLLVPGHWPDGTLPIEPAQRTHLLRVLRRDDGDPVTYTDGAGVLGSGVLAPDGIARGDEQTVHRLGAPIFAVSPPAEKDRQRFVVEKLAELGSPSCGGWTPVTARDGPRRRPGPRRGRVRRSSRADQPG